MKRITEFKNKKDFYKYLVENKSSLINQKKSALKFADPFGTSETERIANKALSTSYTDDLASGKITRTIILNTYLWMDSHDDVHLPGIFTDSIDKNKGNIPHLHDHEFKLTSKVGKPVQFYEKTVNWSELLHGNSKGSTTALFMESDIVKELNPVIFNSYLNDEINQHSVGMQYVSIDLAVNDKDMKQEYEAFNSIIERIGNKSKAMERGYFWAVSKANLIEGSCVIAGSNELTPTLENTKENEEEIILPPVSFFEKMAKAF